jgi:hypothetical protein
MAALLLGGVGAALLLALSAGPDAVLPVESAVAPRVVTASDLAAGTWAELSGASPVSAAAPLDAVTVVWVEAGLAPELVATLEEVDGVVATARVRGGTIGLLGSIGADGLERDVLTPGYRIPVTVMALDPDHYVRTLVGTPDAAEELVVLLRPGMVLLSASSAALRGIDAGGSVDLGGRTGLEVVGVVDDRTARGSEFLVHIDDADEVGLGARESLLVRHEARSVELVADSVEGTEGGLRVWRDGDHVRLVLSHVELKARFGEFAFRLLPGQREVVIDPAFVAEHITIERMPVLGNVRCHRLVMDDLRAALEEVVDAGLEEWLAPRRFGGCFHPRRIGSGRENLSRHSWGIAIDLNVDFSLPGSGPVPPDAFIGIMGRHGFRWGGDFTSPDNHHFEWVGEAARVRPAGDRA